MRVRKSRAYRQNTNISRKKFANDSFAFISVCILLWTENDWTFQVNYMKLTFKVVFLLTIIIDK